MFMFDTESIAKLPYANSHGSDGVHLGAGVLYFSIPYMLKAKVCVCLGSGSGFVPKLMAEAQRQLQKETPHVPHKVYLVDADIGPWGRPEYNDEIDGYPEIKVIRKLTDDAVEMFDKEINYLHVDADHSYDQVLNDLNNYIWKMSGDWAITVHDTYNHQNPEYPEIGSYLAMKDFAKALDFNFVNFSIGCGTALVTPRREINVGKEMGIFNIA